MSLLPSERQYYVYPECVDGRLGYNGLSGLVRNELGRDPRKGDVFIFVNRTRGSLKLLFQDRGGLVLYCKRLDNGTFQVPSGRADGAVYTVSESQLLQLVSGAGVVREKPRKPRGGGGLELER
jgi:transposase